MPKEIFYLIALLAGLAVTIQAGANAQLRLAVGNPVITAMISFLVGTTILVTYVLFTSTHLLPSVKTIAGISWWKWIGGALGVFYIISVIVVAPRIGAASTFGFIVGGQLIFAVIFDHFGVIGFPQHPVSWLRVAGVLLLLAGVYLIQKF
ncbi:DMT family transporter [Adhaeribacter rhizoryzae]|uniref:DMT family transporter n=1 Tax=Adhaeribacter rhizoryzae TaxID=2607907 RepID=A0A5M6DPZ5_9BACT|nr:DMT family transporter [Adhaeribacter rhizoryzae]KAA5549543.1 DMT family transporter [Adhaeribacter rhizoryzae]